MSRTSQKKSAPAPRLSVLLARDAPVGVVLRRGPSKFVRLIVWDRANDEFKLGAWFRGSIHAWCSDVSPDGRHFLYFATGGVKWAIPETGGTWTAISRLPSITAIALWAHGGETRRGGGGRFTSNRSFWLNAGDSTKLIRDASHLRREGERPVRELGRRGWTRADRGSEKPGRNGWILRETATHRYEVEQPGESKIEFPTWTWADWDRSRIVFAEQGRLCAITVGAHKLGAIRTLYDFNGMLPPVRQGA